jgi:undecaprenyl diphosphate synthase
VDKLRVPVHVAIIMDGNGRWATSRGLPRNVGHRRGLDSAKKVIEAASDMGIKYLTLYMFSTENWKRPQEEVDFLMSLPQEFWRRERENLKDKDVRVRILGNLDPLPEETRATLLEASRETKGARGLTVNLAVNYGGRDEILQAAVKYVQALHGDTVKPGEDSFARFLYTEEMPDPDLLIRPGGEQRISNYLLWQIAYAELVFTPTLWPDFGSAELYEAIGEYQRRERRRGGLDKGQGD